MITGALRHRGLASLQLSLSTWSPSSWLVVRTVPFWLEVRLQLSHYLTFLSEAPLYEIWDYYLSNIHCVWAKMASQYKFLYFNLSVVFQTKLWNKQYETRSDILFREINDTVSFISIKSTNNWKYEVFRMANLVCSNKTESNQFLLQKLLNKLFSLYLFSSCKILIKLLSTIVKAVSGCFGIIQSSHSHDLSITSIAGGQSGSEY